MKIVSFDGESNGLHGAVFAIGGVVIEDGRVTEEFFARCPIEGPVDEWVQGNVLPALADCGQTHGSAKAMRAAFWQWLTLPRGEAIVVADCRWPVEAGLFSACIADLLSACVADDPSRAFKGPYPLHEVATFLLAADLDPRAKYAPLVLPDEPDRAHHPVFDAKVSALCVELALGRLVR